MHAEGAEGRRSAGLLGQPLCEDCYDYASHVVWQWFAPDLWRRFTIALHRTLVHYLGAPAARLPEVATMHYAKVAEFQRRGAVHFHALIRLDGPRTAHGYAGAPGTVTADHLAELVREATRSVQLHVPAVDVDDVRRRLVFGRQLDVRVVRSHRPDHDQALLVQASDPARVSAADRSVAFLYRFATGPAFPTNGRVLVKESAATMTPATLRAIAADPEGSAAVTFRMISLGGTPALLSVANGVGRVQFVRGGVEYDVTGPAVRPAEVQRLAALVR